MCHYWPRRVYLDFLLGQPDRSPERKPGETPRKILTKPTKPPAEILRDTRGEALTKPTKPPAEVPQGGFVSLSVPRRGDPSDFRPRPSTPTRPVAWRDG